MELRNDFIGYCCPEPKIKENLLAWQDLKNVNIETTNRAFKDIYVYGKKVIQSDIFRSSFYQQHHYITTVGEHTLHVALFALESAYRMMERGYHINISNVVLACLCHDLGIMGRHEKFKNDIVCCYLYTIHSVVIAQQLIPDLPVVVRTAIARHMFPSMPIPPFSMTGYLLIKGDKLSTYYELTLLKRLRKVPSLT